MYDLVLPWLACRCHNTCSGIMLPSAYLSTLACMDPVPQPSAGICGIVWVSMWCVTAALSTWMSSGSGSVVMVCRSTSIVSHYVLLPGLVFGQFGPFG